MQICAPSSTLQYFNSYALNRRLILLLKARRLTRAAYLPATLYHTALSAEMGLPRRMSSAVH